MEHLHARLILVLCLIAGFAHSAGAAAVVFRHSGQ